MWRSFLAEWPKIRRRSVLSAFAAMLFLSAVGSYLGITRIGSRHGEGFARLSHPDGLVFFLQRDAGLIAVICLITMGAVVGAEWSQGTLRNLLVQEPRRLRLLAGKFLALLLYLMVSALIAIGAASAVATAVAPGAGVDSSGWWTTGLTNYWELLGNMTMAVIGWSIFGLFIAVLLRNAAGAVGASVAWILVIEGLLTQVWPDAARWLPGSLLNTVLQQGTVDVTYTLAVLISCLYAAAMLLFTGANFLWRDVTA